MEELGDFSEEKYLLEFVKVEQSVHLAAIATQQANKMKVMYNLMEEVAKNETQQPYDRDSNVVNTQSERHRIVKETSSIVVMMKTKRTTTRPHPSV